MTESNMDRRRFLRYAAGGSALALAGSWTTALAQSSQLTIGVLRAPASAVIDLADKRGWFKEAGVELKTELFASAAGPKLVQALGGGAIDLSFVNTTASLLGMAGGAIPLRFISICTDPSKLFALLAQPEFDSVPKLAGKKIACTAGTGLQYYLARILAKYGMTQKDIEFVNLPAADGQAAFVAGRVDAIVPSVNGRFYIMQAKKDTRELFGYADFVKPPGSTLPFQNFDLFVTTEAVLATKRKALQSFLAAYHHKGVPFLLNPATRAEALPRETVSPTWSWRPRRVSTSPLRVTWPVARTALASAPAMRAPTSTSSSGPVSVSTMPCDTRSHPSPIAALTGCGSEADSSTSSTRSTISA